YLTDRCVVPHDVDDVGRRSVLLPKLGELLVDLPIFGSPLFAVLHLQDVVLAVMDNSRFGTLLSGSLADCGFLHGVHSVQSLDTHLSASPRELSKLTAFDFQKAKRSGIDGDNLSRFGAGSALVRYCRSHFSPCQLQVTSYFTWTL